MIFLQNLIFYTLFFAATIVLVPILTLLIFVVAIFRPKRVVMRRVRRAISWFGKVVLRCGWPFVRVEYKDLAPREKDGPFIFVCNHRSASDPPLMAVLPFECVQIVNVWPFKLPLYGLIAKIAGYLSVHEMPLEGFFDRVGLLLSQGVCIIAFPEGTRSASREMGPFTSSIFRAAQKHDAKIVPLAIAGNEDIPHKGSVVLHPGRIRIHKLPVVDCRKYRDEPVIKLKNRVRDTLQKHLAEIEG